MNDWGGGRYLGKLGDEALVIVEEVFVTAEDPVHGFVAARAVSVVITLQWLLLLLYLWLLLMLIMMMMMLLLLLLLHDILICRWYVHIQRRWHGEYSVLSHKIFMSMIGIVIIIIIIDNTCAILKFASPFRHDGALGKRRHGDGRKGWLRDW